MNLTDYINQADPQPNLIVNIGEGEYIEKGDFYHPKYEKMVKLIKIPALQVFGVFNSYLLVEGSNILRTDTHKISVFRLTI